MAIRVILFHEWNIFTIEITMDNSLTKNIDEVLDLVKEFIRLKPLIKVIVPKNLSRLKERLKQLHPGGEAKVFADYDLFYRIGLLLQSQREPLTMGDLGEMLKVPLSTATRMIDWLVESGFVVRLPDPEDRRVVRVSLSRKGQELYQTITDFIRQRAGQVLRKFSNDEQANLILLVKKLLKALEEVIR